MMAKSPFKTPHLSDRATLEIQVPGWTIKHPTNGNNADVAAQQRVDALLAAQIAPQNYLLHPLTSIPKPKRPDSPIDISKALTNDELHRVAYLPFVIAEVVWDYADSLVNLAVYLRDRRTKPLCRAVRELRREYERERAHFIDSKHREVEEGHMIGFQEDMGQHTAKLGYCIDNAISKRYGRLDEASHQLVECAYMAVIWHKALFKYCSWADALIERKCGRASHSIMPDEVQRLGILLPQFAGDIEIPTDTPEMNAWRDALCNHIHSIELIPDKELNNNPKH